MQLLVFVLAYPFLWLISILPFRLFYAFSDFSFFLIYRVIGYRKKVVRDNLKLVFPEKSDKEIKKIEKDFYRHMCDLFLEMVKTMHLSKAEVKRRYHIVNIEELKKIEKKKSILLACSHYANWEWNTSINNYIDAKGYAVYQKISNTYFDGLIRRIRARWNTTLLTQKEAMVAVVRNHKNNVRAIYGMVNDQSPQAHLAQYWTEFMGIKAPVYTGTESLARKLDLAVVFLKVSKVKRGYYKAEFIPISTSSKSTEKNEITDRFLRLTEQQIRERPEHYLWTHRRWKHRDKVPDEFL
ncbi:lysophospholipid acyltransferase family protein [Ulvibacterium sp.]|uniref:lysophospholipid acyltransferase family protein n=1 Tax=Ulvibacterium sp. TaxID=2665914 RepID=UPI00262C9182|nr:lysophospholipid acyltransferase family protein [Ulvibacterium sp.]